jgi:hypothetical protein
MERRSNTHTQEGEMKSTWTPRTVTRANEWIKANVNPHAVVEKREYTDRSSRRDSAGNAMSRTHTKYEAKIVIDGETVRFLGSDWKLRGLMKRLMSGLYL